MNKSSSSSAFAGNLFCAKMRSSLQLGAAQRRSAPVLLSACLAVIVSISERAFANTGQNLRGEFLTCLNIEDFRNTEESQLHACFEQMIESCYRLETGEDVDACFAVNATELREFNQSIAFHLANSDTGKSRQVAEAQFLRATNQNVCIKESPENVLDACMLAVEFGYTAALLYVSQNRAFE